MTRLGVYATPSYFFKISSNLFWKDKVQDLKKRNPTLIKPLPSDSDDWKAVFFDEIKIKKFLENPNESLEKHPELKNDKFFIIAALDSEKLTIDYEPSKSLQKDEDVKESLKRAFQREIKKIQDESGIILSALSDNGYTVSW